MTITISVLNDDEDFISGPGFVWRLKSITEQNFLYFLMSHSLTACVL